MIFINIAQQIGQLYDQNNTHGKGYNNMKQ